MSHNWLGKKIRDPEISWKKLISYPPGNESISHLGKGKSSTQNAMFWGYVSSLESNPYRYNSVLFDPLQVPTSKQGFFSSHTRIFTHWPNWWSKFWQVLVISKDNSKVIKQDLLLLVYIQHVIFHIWPSLWSPLVTGLFSMWKKP